MGDNIAKKFISRKKHKQKELIKIVFYVVILFIFYLLAASIIFDVKISSSNEQLLKSLLIDTSHHLKTETKHNNILSKIINIVYKIDLSNPVTIIENTYTKESAITSSDEAESPDKNAKYITDPNPINLKDPTVYIYNTHQLENYSYKKYEDYNITPSVMTAAYILREKLNNSGISTMVETGNITELLKVNAWDYSKSYEASSYYLKEALNKYKNLKLIIDLHRDSVSKEASTVTIENKNYAKILFVIGMEYKTYEKNLKVAETLNNIVKKTYPELTRGIIKKSGNNVNGIYNQNLKENIILIELGSNNNTIEEVTNTIEILSKIIKEYIEGTNET